MKLILLKSVNNLGRRGAIIEVSDGYARNFLLPQKLAAGSADRKALALIRAESKTEKTRREKSAQAARAIAALSGKNFELARRVNEKGSLYSQVSARDIAEFLEKKLGLQIGEKEISVQTQLKHLGKFEVAYTCENNRAVFSLIINSDTHDGKKSV